jgi:hypothetical protein
MMADVIAITWSSLILDVFKAPSASHRKRVRQCTKSSPTTARARAPFRLAYYSPCAILAVGGRLISHFLLLFVKIFSLAWPLEFFVYYMVSEIDRCKTLFFQSSHPRVSAVVARDQYNTSLQYLVRDLISHSENLTSYNSYL